MVIINAYLGAGSGGGVPVGKCLLNVAWNPSDGNNKSGATVRAVIGSTTVTGTTDSSGNASLLVGTGSCTVTVTPASGTYTNLSATVTAESTTTKTVVINGQAGRKVTLVVPYTLTTTSWNIKDSGNTQKASGTGAFNDKEVTLNDGSYTLSITAYGVTKTKTFTVSSTSTRIDCTDITCVITIRLPRNLATTITIGGVALASNQGMVCVLRNSAALSYSGTVTTTLDGSAIATVTSSTITPSGATATLTPTVTGSRKLITATKTLAIPVTGHYKIFLIGGGGGGAGLASGSAQYGAGGGGGYMVLETLKVTKGNYIVTIGNGGALNENGGASSFGSLLSVNGGGAGNYGPGGNGGSGGGAGGSNSSSTNGGHATFGGGGGAMYNSSTQRVGTGGIFGGDGGEKGTAGGSGRAMQNADSFFSSTGSGYTGGTSASGRGGGGGGGYGAKGGNAVNGTAGGGGGGVAGGNGGNGGVLSDGNNTHGLGYGSGGKGGTGSSSSSGGGGGGGLYNIAQSGNAGANGACIIMWIG